MSESTQEPQASAGTSPADEDSSGDNAMPQEPSLGGVSDDKLPEDLQPSEDNPLAQPLDPEDEATKSREELEMDATQDDMVVTEDGASTGPAPEDVQPGIDESRQREDAAESQGGGTGGGANSGEGSQGAGLAEG